MKNSSTLCSVEGCTLKKVCKGKCNKHYQRDYRGFPEDSWADNTTLTQRVVFWLKELQKDGHVCWEIPKTMRYSNGYGAIAFDNKKYLAHRAVYSAIHGSIPRELDVCHACDNRACINPSHLWLGTRKQNMEDMVAKGRQGRKKRAA
jgi:hypothetical protein